MKKAKSKESRIVMYVFMIYLVVINFYGYLLMGNDKMRAKQRKRRISEAKLFWVAGLGGALGVLVGMRRYRHKTLHLSFRLGIPVLLIINVGISGLLFKLF